MNLRLSFFLIYSYIIQVFSVNVHSDDYKLLDNPYENDIESSTAEYHNILTSVAAISYTDYYKGIVYKNSLCCYYDSYHDRCTHSGATTYQN